MTDRANEISLCLVSRTCILLVPAKASEIGGTWKMQALKLHIQYPNGSQLEAGVGEPCIPSFWHRDVIRIGGGQFSPAASLFPHRAKRLPFSHMARGAGSVKAELLQLGRKRKKWQ